MIPRSAITGLVLAGGAGRRMGGRDKGLVPWRGEPLAAHALRRLAPQVASCLVSANRHLDDYAALGVPVVTDASAGHAGPLAGLLAGLAACRTGWLAAVPCDTPRFPDDLVARLAQAAQAAGAPVAMAATSEAGGLQPQPVFCLVQARLLDDLAAWLAAGGASPRQWAARHGVALVPFPDAAAFANANTPDDLARLGQ